MSDADEILIGEGVALESGAAPVTLRMLSGLLDVAITFAALYFAFAVFDAIPFNLNDAWLGAISILITFTCLVFLPMTVETLTRGKSLGRLAVGLRTVRDDGGPITVRHAFIRALVGVVEIYMTAGMLAVGTSMLSSRGKRIGDYLAGTYSMRTRGGGQRLAPLMMPPHLAHWANTADIARLPDSLALTGRLFLGRAASMRPESRDRIGRQIAAQVGQYVSPPPPPGTHPEYFLAAVLTSRRDREYAQEVSRLRRADAETARVGALPYGVVDAEK
ncbi:RDD family protein [Demequina sp.]|uniref:RDD family protein n=1 Tax=Demequina sp. TaxID=2050685 RepID=UPI003D0E11EA